jgi:hypothetical protein
MIGLPVAGKFKETLTCFRPQRALRCQFSIAGRENSTLGFDMARDP